MFLTRHIVATFDRMLDTDATPGMLPEDTVFRGLLQMDHHGRWAIVLIVGIDVNPEHGKVFAGWLSVDTDDVPRTMLASGHRLLLSGLTWMTSTHVKDRGTIFHGVVRWDADLCNGFDQGYQNQPNPNITSDVPQDDRDLVMANPFVANRSSTMSAIFRQIEKEEAEEAAMARQHN